MNTAAWAAGSSHGRRPLTFSRLARVAWRLRWALLGNLYLLSPLALYELRATEGALDKKLLFALAASVLSLIAVQVMQRRLWIAHALLLPMYLVVALDLYAIAHYQTRLGSSLLLVVAESIMDTGDYLRANYGRLIMLITLWAAGYGFLLTKLRHVELRAPRGTFSATLALLVLVYGAARWYAGSTSSWLTYDRGSPFGVIAQSVVAAQVYRESVRAADAAKDFEFGARRVQGAPAASELEAYVLVIGESVRPDHLGVNGYARNTTPLLERTHDLVTFEDAIAQIAVTRISVPLMLTRRAIERPGHAEQERSIVTAFREAGFRTHWLSTQQRDPYTGAIHRYSGEAHTQRFFEREYDEVLAERATERLLDRSQRKLMLVVHMQGSHFHYESRYPPAFARFDTSRGSARERLVAAYDNTLLYTDFVLARIISALQARSGVSALLYVSDHGENLLDDERALTGHYSNNEHDLAIGMLFWPSPEFVARYPGKLRAVRRNARLPVNTRSVFHTLLDIGSSSVGDPRTPELSLLSDAFSPPARMVFHRERVIDFDALHTH